MIAAWICREASAACVDTCAISRIETTTWSEAVRCCCVAIEICLAASVVSSTWLDDRVERVGGAARELLALVDLLAAPARST